MSFNLSKKVAVLRGGKNHFKSSLKTGEFILKNIPKTFEVSDILVDENGVWHFKGVPKKPENILFKTDFVWNTLYDISDSDINLPKLLESFNIKHTSHSPFVNTLCQHKHLSKNLFKNINIKTPHHILIDKNSLDNKKIYEIFTTFPHPAVVKPENFGHSLGVSVVTNLKELKEGIEKALTFSPTVILEEYINGKEFFVAICDDFRGKHPYVFPILEVKKGHYPIFHQDLKDDFSNDILYSNLPLNIKNDIENIALSVYKSSGLKNFASVDIVAHPKRGIFVLEVNTKPQIHDKSPFVLAMSHAGVLPSEFVSSVIGNLN